MHCQGIFGPAARHRSAVVAFGRPSPLPAPVEPQSLLPLDLTPMPRPRRHSLPSGAWLPDLHATPSCCHRPLTVPASPCDLPSGAHMAATPTKGQSTRSNETLSYSPPRSTPLAVPTARPEAEVTFGEPLVNRRESMELGQLAGTRWALRDALAEPAAKVNVPGEGTPPSAAVRCPAASPTSTRRGPAGARPPSRAPGPAARSPSPTRRANST